MANRFSICASGVFSCVLSGCITDGGGAGSVSTACGLENIATAVATESVQSEQPMRAAVLALSGMDAGSSCWSIHRSMPIRSTRSRSPGRGPKVRRLSTCHASASSGAIAMRSAAMAAEGAAGFWLATDGWPAPSPSMIGVIRRGEADTQATIVATTRTTPPRNRETGPSMRCLRWFLHEVAGGLA